jgi:hypothetical protein
LKDLYIEAWYTLLPDNKFFYICCKIGCDYKSL